MLFKATCTISALQKPKSEQRKYMPKCSVLYVIPNTIIKVINGYHIFSFPKSNFYLQGFIIHLSGFYASIYWAYFPSEYLRIINAIGVDVLPSQMRITLRYTPAYNLLDPGPRTTFLKHLIALIRYLAAGLGDVGHLRLPGTKIHRTVGDVVDGSEKEENAPEWMGLDYQEDEQWINDFGMEYEP